MMSKIFSGRSVLKTAGGSTVLWVQEGTKNDDAERFRKEMMCGLPHGSPEWAKICAWQLGQTIDWRCSLQRQRRKQRQAELHPRPEGRHSRRHVQLQRADRI